jgi:hypothetical protein
MHVDEELAAYLPAGHAMQANEALVEYSPATHTAHVDDDAAEYVPAKQFTHVVAPDAADSNTDDHDPVKPLRVREPSDVNVTLRNPVDEVYTLDELRDPECLRMRCDDDSQLHL